MYNFDPTQKPPVLVSVLIVVGIIVGIAYAVTELAEQLNK
jgi:type III secretory pathway component EscS